VLRARPRRRSSERSLTSKTSRRSRAFAGNGASRERRSRHDASRPGQPVNGGGRSRSSSLVTGAVGRDTVAADLEEERSPGRNPMVAESQGSTPSSILPRIKASKATASLRHRVSRKGDVGDGTRKNAKEASGASDRVTAVGVVVSFGGWSRRRGGSGSWETDFTIRNAANPRTGCRVQQTCEPSRGESRRGGEKPRGRNRTSRLVASGPKVDSSTGSVRAADVSVEGRTAGIRRVTVGCQRTPREEAGSPAGARRGLCRGAGARRVDRRAAERHARRRLRAPESRGPAVREHVEIAAGQGDQRPVGRSRGRETTRGANRALVTTTSGADNLTRAPAKAGNSFAS
jgi:hypothetical protein